MTRVTILFLLMIINFQSASAQDKTEVSKAELISELFDAYVFIDSVELEYVEEYISSYYHNKLGMFTYKTYINPNQELALKNTLALIESAKAADLIKETVFKEFDKDHLKTLVLKYPEKDQLNFIYFNKRKGMGYHRAYKIRN